MRKKTENARGGLILSTLEDEVYNKALFFLVLLHIEFQTYIV